MTRELIAVATINGTQWAASAIVRRSERGRLVVADMWGFERGQDGVKTGAADVPDDAYEWLELAAIAAYVDASRDDDTPQDMAADHYLDQQKERA